MKTVGLCIFFQVETGKVFLLNIVIANKIIGKQSAGIC